MSIVSMKENDIVFLNRSTEPLNPHPAFPKWSQYDIYPYLFMGGTRYSAVKQSFRMVTMENEYLRVMVAPDIGGRVWSIYDKISKRHAINYSSQVITYQGGFGRNYTCGGLEINYPLAHSCTTSRKHEYRTDRHSDGSKSVLISEYDQIWRTRWFTRFTLRPGKSYLEQTVRIYNRSLHDSRYKYWANCGIPVNDQTMFIFPENIGSVHGKDSRNVSWPIWKHQNVAYWKNVVEPLGLYMLDATEPYFGYYDFGASYGFVHYGDLADLPGKKNWSWGSQFLGRVANAKTHNADGHAYGEIQSGRIVIQEHMDRMHPETEAQWTEYWFPVRNTDGINGVGKDAALNVKAEIEKPNQATLKIKAIGSGTFRNIILSAGADGRPAVQKKIDLNPATPVTVVLSVPWPEKSGKNFLVKLATDDGRILAQARLKETPVRDSWHDIYASAGGAKPRSAEEIFMEGEFLARHWQHHNGCEMYAEAIKMDPGLSAANREMGKALTFRGEYAKAVEYLKKALERDPDNLDASYSMGTALLLAGKIEDSSRFFEKAARYDYESRARTRLAEISIRAGNIHHALQYLERVTSRSPLLTRPMTLKAICLRLLGRLPEAFQAVQRATAVDPADPFPLMETMLIENKWKRKSLSSPLKLLIRNIRDYEPPYLEAVLDYGNLGLYQDAFTLLNRFPDKGPIAMFYQAFIESRLGKKNFRATLQKACRLDPAGHCLWQLEMIPVMEWAATILGRNSRPFFFLGNLLVARHQLDKGVAQWKKAVELGDRSYLLYSNLGFYENTINKDKQKALKYFLKANQLEPKDPYVIIEKFKLLKAAGRADEALRFLEKDMPGVRAHARLAFVLMNEYIKGRKYAEFDKLVPSFHFNGNWQMAGPHSFWMARHINEALDLFAAGEYKKTVELLEKATRVPENLGMTVIEEQNKQERILYHLGRSHEKLGDMAKAKSLWETAVGIDRVYAWDPGSAYSVWNQRYFQALCLKKLGRLREANLILDGMEILAKDPELAVSGREYLIDLVARARFGKEDEYDPYMKKAVEVQLRAEL